MDFEYDKVIRKLSKIDDLGSKKAFKNLDKVLYDETFHRWLNCAGDRNQNADQVATPAMIATLINVMIHPSVLKMVSKRLRATTSADGFSDSTLYFIMMVLDHAVDTMNKESTSINTKYKAGEIDSKAVRQYKSLSEEYSSIIDKVSKDTKEAAFSFLNVKERARAASIDKDLMYAAMLGRPESKYIPRYKIGSYIGSILDSVYSFTGNNGHPGYHSKNIAWAEFFNTLIGTGSLESVSVSILLEGVRKIDSYCDLHNDRAIMEVWDDLTVFALDTLNKASDNVRGQMVELYLKRATNIFRSNGSTAQLRVNMMTLPDSYSRLIDTITKHRNGFDRLMGNNYSNGNRQQAQVNQQPRREEQPRRDDTRRQERRRDDDDEPKQKSEKNSHRVSGGKANDMIGVGRSRSMLDNPLLPDYEEEEEDNSPLFSTEDMDDIIPPASDSDDE